MLKHHGFALEAGREDEIPAVCGHDCKRPRRLHVNVLELVKGFGLRVPEVDLCEGVVAAEGEVVPVSEGERLEDHGSSRRQSLHLREHLVGPFEDLGVTDVAGRGQVQVSVLPKRFDCHHVVHILNLTMENELQGAFVPQVDDR